MGNSTLIMVVVLMGAVTYLPRMIPLVLLGEVKLSPFLKNFLRNIPYAVLGALIFPGIITSTGKPLSAMVGGLAAVVLAYFRLNLIIVVFGGIGAVFLCEILSGAAFN